MQHPCAGVKADDEALKRSLGSAFEANYDLYTLWLRGSPSKQYGAKALCVTMSHCIILVQLVRALTCSHSA